jgi:lipoprotein NlpI
MSRRLRNVVFVSICAVQLIVVASMRLQAQDAVQSALVKASELLSQDKGKEAVAELDVAIGKQPNNVSLLQLRAETLFRIGEFEKSMKDFDKVVELKPQLKAENWQRGIALYYVGRFKDGADQFEEHHRVNPDDVENTFWFFLCLAKAESIEAARKKIIPSRGDARPPLMEIYKLVRGEVMPADVEKSISQFTAGTSGREQAEFYGYLYLGLWFDLQGDKPKAIDYLKKSLAANDRGYMADVGKVHLKTLQSSPSR